MRFLRFAADRLRGSPALAALILVVGGLIQLAKIAALTGIVMLAAIGALTLLGR